jgi:hypothetical protein
MQVVAAGSLLEFAWAEGKSASDPYEKAAPRAVAGGGL